jgi:hypothetical protein
MAHLIKAPNLKNPDKMYQHLIDMHQGCDEAESHKRNAKLILALSNHIGDETVIAEAIALVLPVTANEDSK